MVVFLTERKREDMKNDSPQQFQPQLCFVSSGDAVHGAEIRPAAPIRQLHVEFCRISAYDIISAADATFQFSLHNVHCDRIPTWRRC